MKRIDWLRLLILSLVWGGSFIFFRILAAQLPPLTTVFSRTLIGTLAVLVFMRVDKTPLIIPRSQVPKLALLGLINCVLPFTLYAWGETRVSAGVASIINATTPMFTLLVAGLVFRNDKLTGGRIAGVLCGMAGVAVVVGPDVLLGADTLGEIACLLAPLSYGFAFQVGRRITGLTPPALACAQLGMATLLIFPLMVGIDQPWNLPSPPLSGWLAIAGLGVLSTGFAYVVYFRVLASAGPTNLSLVTLLVPVSAVLLGWGVLSEPMAPRAAGGMALIAVGLAAIDGRLIRRVRGFLNPQPAAASPRDN